MKLHRILDVSGHLEILLMARRRAFFFASGPESRRGLGQDD